MGIALAANIATPTLDSIATNSAPELTRAPLTREEVIDLIALYADRYGVKEKLVLDVARCESQFKSDAVGDGGKAYGVFQFHKPTFIEFAKEFGDETLDYKNPEHNIKLGVWGFAKGKQAHWTCYDKISLR